MLEKITKSCDAFQRLSSEPGRFRVALPHEDVVFSRLLYLDLMSLDGDSVLRIVCKDTLFSAASFPERESSRNVWRAYLRH